MSVNKNTATPKTNTQKITELFESLFAEKIEKILLEQKTQIFGQVDSHLFENFAPALVTFIQNASKNGALNESVEANKVKVSRSLKANVIKFLNESEEEDATKEESLKEDKEEKEEALKEAKLTESKLVAFAKKLNEAKEQADEEEDGELKEAIKENIALKENENRKALTEARKQRRLLENEIDEIVDELQDLGAMSVEETGIPAKDTLVESADKDKDEDIDLGEDEEEDKDKDLNEDEEDKDKDKDLNEDDEEDKDKDLNEDDEEDKDKDLYESLKADAEAKQARTKSLLESIKSEISKGKQLDATKK